MKLSKNFPLNVYTNFLAFPEDFEFQELFDLIKQSFENESKYYTNKEIDRAIMEEAFCYFDILEENLESSQHQNQKYFKF